MAQVDATIVAKDAEILQNSTEIPVQVMKDLILVLITFSLKIFELRTGLKLTTEDLGKILCVRTKSFTRI